MPIIFDSDPVTGVVQYYSYDPLTDSHSITSVQDVTPLLEALKKKRDNPDAWKKGVKESWAHYATIPSIVEIKLKQKGIDIYNKNQTKEIIKAIESEFPYLKATVAKHA